MVGLAVLCLFVFGAGYLGRFHPAGDSFSLVRLPAAVLASVFALFTLWPRLVKIVIAAVALVPLAAFLVQYLSGDQDIGDNAPFVAYQKNVLYSNREGASLIDELIASNADVVFLQETRRLYRQMQKDMVDAYPYRFSCLSNERSTAVMSKWPVIQGTQTCFGSEAAGGAGFRVNTPHGFVWVVSIHLYWPWPAPQMDQLNAILGQLEKLEGKVIIGGDFNMSPSGHSVQAVERATGTSKIGSLKATRFKAGYPVSIDHVLATGWGRIETRPYFGSDHLGVLAEVVFDED